MSAWTRLLAASSLAIGSAWDLITHPLTGTGTPSATGAVTVLLPPPITITVTQANVAVSLAHQPVIVSLPPDIAITVQPPIRITP
jgi:hypothetical protein